MQKKATITLPEFIQAFGIVAILIGVVAIFASINGNRVIQQRDAEGIQVSATVVSKRQEWVSSSRTTTRVNAFDIMYFEKTEYKDEVWDLGDGFEITMPTISDIGDFYSSTVVRVPDRIYNKTAEGDSVEIIYLESDPERVWLAEQVADVGLWDGLGFIIGCFIVSIASFVFSSRLSKNN